MAITHYAQLDSENKVIRVEVVDVRDVTNDDGSRDPKVSFLKSEFGLDTVWVETFYDGSSRHRYAGIGMTYSSDLDVFIDIKPEQYPSWVLNEETYAYEPPVSEPTLTEEQITNGDIYLWNESTVSWDFVEGPGPPAPDEPVEEPEE